MKYIDVLEDVQLGSGQGKDSGEEVQGRRENRQQQGRRGFYTLFITQPTKTIQHKERERGKTKEATLRMVAHTGLVMDSWGMGAYSNI